MFVELKKAWFKYNAFWQYIASNHLLGAPGPNEIVISDFPQQWEILEELSMASKSIKSQR